MKKLDDTPKSHFCLYAAPGPLALSPDGKLALSPRTFEEHPLFTSIPGAATESLDDKRLEQWLRANRVDTVIGRLRFDSTNNYGDDLSKIKQVQDGK